MGDIVNRGKLVDVWIVVMKTGLSRDDDLDLNLNDLNLECLDETAGDPGISGGVLGASASFSPSGVLNFVALNLKCNSSTFLGNYFLHIRTCCTFMTRKTVKHGDLDLRNSLAGNRSVLVNAIFRRDLKRD